MRSHGDNGIARAVTQLNNQLDIWSQKLNTYVNAHVNADEAVNAAKPIEIDWIAYHQSIEDCLNIIKHGLNKIGTIFKDVREDSASARSDERPIE